MYDGTLVGKWEDGKDRIWEVKPMLATLDSLFSEKEIKAKDVENELKSHSTKSVKVDAKITVKKKKSKTKRKRGLIS